MTLRCREPLLTIPLHPLTVTAGVGLQWAALLRRGPEARWRGRVYAAAPDERPERA